jgi:hypothetical protein
MIYIDNGLVYRSCEKVTDYPYDSNYARNSESQILMEFIS